MKEAAKVSVSGTPAPPSRSLRRAAAAVLAALAAAGVPGCAAWFSPFRIPEGRPPDLRFASRTDLGIPEGPLPLDVVFTIHPQIRLQEPAAPEAQAGWGRREAPIPFDRAGAFRSLTGNVLAETFASAVEAAPGSHVRLEDLRRSLGQERLPEEIPLLNAKALVLVDFRPWPGDRPGLAAQLAVKVYDISYGGYDRMTLFNPRLLVFEDFAEVEPAEDPAKFPGTIFLAWKEILSRMRESRRFQKYLSLGREPLGDSSPDGEVLLGIVPPERIPKTPDPSCHEWIEEELLFARPVQAEKKTETPAPPPAEPAEGADAPGPVWADGGDPGEEPAGPPWTGDTGGGDPDRIGPPPIEGPEPPARAEGGAGRPGEGR